MLKRSFFMSTTALAGGCLFAVSALAADLYVAGEPVLPTVLPAVSGVNGKISLEGGALDAEGFAAFKGSISLPLGQQFGLQVDGAVGVLDEEFIGGGGGHLFWRDPSIALLGIYGSYTTIEALDGDIARLGVEGEYYWNQLTLKAVIGAEFIDIDAPVDYDGTNLFAFSDLSYYANDNLELSVGHRYTGEKHALALGVEYQLSQQVFASGVSLFAEGRIGEDDYKGAWAGVRMYLGDEKTLIRRHREDDPTDWEEDNLLGIVNAAGNGCVPNAAELRGEGPYTSGEGFIYGEGYNTCTGKEVYFASDG